jgi:multidrug efflux system outer membrane protein
VRSRDLACAAPLLLAACAAPEAPPPAGAAVAPPSAWRTDAGATVAVVPGWWRSLGDPVLDALVERALANNPDIGIAVGRVREARAQETLARAQLFPSLDLGASASHGRSLSALGTANESTVAQPVFQAAYELDLFGRISSQVEAARASALASEAARHSVRLSVAAATATSYVTLRGLDARLAIVRATVAARADALRIARDRAEIGYTSQLELRQAEAEYRAATQIVPQAQLAIARQENALSVLVGENPRDIARGVGLDALRRPAVPDGLPSDLLRRRPDIVQAERTLAASDASLAAARAQFLPQLRLTGSAGAVGSSLIGDPVGIWSLGGSVLAPLFQGGRLRAGVESAAGRRDQAAFAYQRTVLTAFREVEDNLAAVIRLAEQRTQIELQRDALSEALRHATNRYQAGYSSYLEQLDAQRNLLSAELTLVQLEVDQLNALIALHQAVGGGWRT